MATSVTLEKLVHAIASSIMEAQHLVEKAQLSNISSFFNEKKQPSTLELELPSMRRNAAPGECDLYRLPLISLVPHSSLVISEATVDLDVELGALTNDSRSPVHSMLADKAANVAPAPEKPALMVDPEAGGIAKKNGNAAHITLKVVSAETPEGMARLLNDVIKGQGFIGVGQTTTTPADTSTPHPDPISP